MVQRGNVEDSIFDTNTGPEYIERISINKRQSFPTSLGQHTHNNLIQAVAFEMFRSATIMKKLSTIVTPAGNISLHTTSVISDSER